MKNYDSHIIFKSLAGLNKEIDKINIIGINLEKYISFEIGNMRFIDSYQFLARHLADLIQELKNNNSDKLHLLRTFLLTTDFFNYDFDKINLTTEKVFTRMIMLIILSNSNYHYLPKKNLIEIH